MGLLDRAAILGMQDLRTEDVPVPEWGGTVRIRGLTGTERDALEMTMFDPASGKRDYANLRARLVVLSAVDEQGRRLFSPEDVEVLGGKSVAALDRLYEVAQRLSGLRAKDVEELAGNSGAARNGSSSSS